jgi:hypothetical protein
VSDLGKRLDRYHRHVLQLLADRTEERNPDPGATTSSATFADTYNVWVHWRTADWLRKRGYITITSDNWPESSSIAVTDAGRAAIEETL